MKTVWKYELMLSDRAQEVSMPLHAAVVHFAVQGNVPCLWALVDPDGDRETRYFSVHGTGHPINDSLGYRGTCLSGQFVWHLFEVL